MRPTSVFLFSQSVSEDRRGAWSKVKVTYGFPLRLQTDFSIEAMRLAEISPQPVSSWDPCHIRRSPGLVRVLSPITSVTALVARSVTIVVVCFNRPATDCCVCPPSSRNPRAWSKHFLLAPSSLPTFDQLVCRGTISAVVTTVSGTGK